MDRGFTRARPRPALPRAQPAEVTSRARGVGLETFIRNEALIVAALALVGTVVPVVLGASSGTLDIPRNDDWSFRRTALGLWSTGHLAFDGVAGMMLIGQVALVQPLLWLAGNPLAFVIAGVAASSALTAATYVLARQFVSPGRAFLVTSSLLLFPGYLAYSTSFMTDVPTAAAEIAAVAVAVRAVSTRNIRLLAVAMVLAVLGFSIRQFALAAVGVIALAAIGVWPRRWPAWAIALVGLGGCLLLQAIRSMVPGELEPLPPQIWFVTRLPQAAVTVSLMALPAAVVAIVTNRRAWRAHDLLYGATIGIAIAIATAALWVRQGTFPDALLGNLATQLGVLDVLDLAGGRPVLFTDAFWTAVNLLGVASTVIVSACIAATLGTRMRDHEAGRRRLVGQVRTPVGLVATFAVLYGLGVVTYGTTLIVFDRYLWPLVPPIAILLVLPVKATHRSRPSREPMWGRVFRPLTVLPLMAMTVTGILALTLMLNAFAFDAARWRAGEQLAATGLPADAIDAGYEWVGFHATSPAHMAHPTKSTPPYRGWWDTPVCGLVTASPDGPRNGRLVGIEDYRLYLIAGPRVDLYLYRIESPDC